MLVTEQIIPVGSTGNGTFTQRANENLDNDRAVLHFLVEAVGATPTVTYNWQGSFDGTNWFDIRYITEANETAANGGRTVTAVGAYASFRFEANRFYPRHRVVVSANTNVTYSAKLLAQTRAD